MRSCATLRFSIYDGFFLPQASWIALLSIAHRYEFLNVRERAIREIYGPFQDDQKFCLVSREQKEKELRLLISVAEKYDVPPRFIAPLLVPFVGRKQPLTEDEVLSLSALTVSRLAHAREDFQREYRTQNWRSPDAVAKEVVYKIWQV
jgi:hypothetical protein